MSNTKRFAESYVTGEMLRLVGDDAETVALAYVLNYDPVTAAHRLPNEPEERNHWHIAILEPESNVWLPAAIWQGRTAVRDGLGAHLSRFHTIEEEWNTTLNMPRDPFPHVFTTKELLDRVYMLIANTVSVESLEIQ